MNNIVELHSGRVRGLTYEKYRLFQGIPYAAPPVGERRWCSPQPVDPWPQVRDATEPGSPCPQLPQDFADIASLDEDCLFLNVTAPRTGGSKPVMVWLHGGGGANGEGAIFDAHRLAVAEDVVVVTPNSRLGIFGNFGYPSLAGGGGFGIEDQQAVLRWVQRNIDAFGGDPGNVTLFGESYGGLNVSAHLVAPGSAGLFHRAIVQSGFALLRSPAGAWAPGSPEMPAMWLSTVELEELAEHLVGQLGWVQPGKEGGGDRAVAPRPGRTADQRVIGVQPASFRRRGATGVPCTGVARWAVPPGPGADRWNPGRGQAVHGAVLGRRRSTDHARRLRQATRRRLRRRSRRGGRAVPR